MGLRLRASGLGRDFVWQLSLDCGRLRLDRLRTNGRDRRTYSCPTHSVRAELVEARVAKGPTRLLDAGPSTGSGRTVRMAHRLLPHPIRSCWACRSMGGITNPTF